MRVGVGRSWGILKLWLDGHVISSRSISICDKSETVRTRLFHTSLLRIPGIFAIVRGRGSEPVQGWQGLDRAMRR